MSSRIADIIIEARLETAQFTRTLGQLRGQIEFAFKGIRGAHQPISKLQEQIRGTGGEVERFGSRYEGMMIKEMEMTEKATAALDLKEAKQRKVQKAAEDAGKTVTKEMKKAEKTTEDLMTQMRWVARDVMKIGFTAGVIGAVFGRTFQDMASVSFDLLAIFEDLRYVLEDIWDVIGRQIAPILATLIPPMEMVRDFLESHKAIAKLVGIVIILGMVFFALASVILMTAGMYAIILFGMRQFSETTDKVRADTKHTAGMFKTMNNFVGGMVKSMAGIPPPTKAAGDAIAKMGEQIQWTINRAKMAITTFGILRSQALTPQEVLGKIGEWKESGQISRKTYNEMRKNALKHMPAQQRLNYHLEQTKKRLNDMKSSAKGAYGKIRSGMKRVPGAIKGAAQATSKLVAGLAAMVMMAAVLAPLLSALDPVITALASAISAVIEPIEPLLWMMSEFIENNKALTIGILAVAVAIATLSAVSLPIAVIFGAILAVIMLLDAIFKRFGITLFGSGVHQAMVMVTKASLMLLSPLYSVYKIAKNAGKIFGFFTRVIQRFVGIIRGVGAFIRNIIPEPLIDVAMAISNLFTNPITLLRSFLDILGGIWDIFTGDWKGGVGKIGQAVVDIIAEFFKIPIAVCKIGIDVLKWLWKGIVLSTVWLWQKLTGGSLIWDIVAKFTLIPIALLKIGADMIVQLLQGIQNKVTNLFGDDGVGGVIAKVINAFIEVPKTLFSVGSLIMTNLIAGIMGKWEDLFGGRGLSWLKTSIIGVFKKIPTVMLGIGQLLIQKLLDGIMGMWGALFGTESGLGKMGIAIVNFFKKKIDQAYYWGTNLIQGIIDGIVDMAPFLLRALSNALGIGDLFPGSKAKKGPLKDLRKWGAGIPSELSVGMKHGIDATPLFAGLGDLGKQQSPVGGGDIILNSDFVIHATITSQQDLMSLSDEISMKQLEQARRMRILTGGR